MQDNQMSPSINMPNRTRSFRTKIGLFCFLIDRCGLQEMTNTKPIDTTGPASIYSIGVTVKVK